MIDVLHVARVVHLVLDGLGHVSFVHEPLQEGRVRNTIHPRRHVELVMKTTTARAVRPKVGIWRALMATRAQQGGS